MSLSPTHKSEIKSACLSSVSLHVIQLGYGVLPEFECGKDTYAYDDQNNNIWAFIVWIRLWVHWLCCPYGGGQDAPFAQQTAHGLNRHRRRKRHRKIPPARNLMPYHKFFAVAPDGRRLSPAQFLERLCQLSVFGRIRIYRMRQFGSVLRRRALLVCYDHGWWREPISHMGRVRCGFWQVQLWPNWRLQFLVPMHQLTRHH